MRTLTLCLLLPGLASADLVDPGETLMRGYSVWLGGFFESGDTELSDYGGGLAPEAFGLRYYERQGIITGTIMGILTAASAGVQANTAKSVTTERRGNWEVTTTVHRSEAEKAQIREEGAARASRLASASNQSFELDLFMTTLGGDASGYRMNGFYGIPMGESWVFDFGFGGGEVDSAFEHEGKVVRLGYSYFGMPFRLNVAAGRCCCGVSGIGIGWATATSRRMSTTTPTSSATCDRSRCGSGRRPTSSGGSTSRASPRRRP